jgi:ornithine cyclodeaminase/alanine dehydrogenase-like protein (mu-crystallin family)
LRYLSGKDLRGLISMGEAIDAVRSGFSALSAGNSITPLRTPIAAGRHGTVLVMPVYLPRENTTTVKVVSLCPGNVARGLPLLQALVQVFDGETGTPLAVIEGAGLTRLRTGAASGLATDLLARADSHTAAIIGAGVQGASQLEAVCAVRPITEAWAYDPDRTRLEAFCAHLSDVLRRPVRPAGTVHEALAGADVVCTATTSSQPVIPDAAVRAGTHVNAVGAYRPEARELPGELIRRSRVFVDSIDACLEEAGDLLIPIKQGLITREHLAGEIGQLVNGTVSGRLDDRQVTVFKSVGVAVQDGAVAAIVARQAELLGIGIALPI